MQFSFLETAIHRMMDEAGFTEMSEETRNQFLPQFVAEAERRIGLAYTAVLDEAGAEAFADLFSGAEVNPEAVQAFLATHVPQYQELANETLNAFAIEFKAAVGEMQ
jgi:hypothetical protein